MFSALPLAFGGWVASSMLGVQRGVRWKAGFEAAAPMAAAAITDSLVTSGPFPASLNAGTAWITRVAVSSVWAAVAYSLHI
eukprot:2522166-Pyramimonas_sp.AAC.1